MSRAEAEASDVDVTQRRAVKLFKESNSRVISPANLPVKSSNVVSDHFSPG